MLRIAALLLLAACGGGKPAPAPPANAAPPAAAAEPAVQAPASGTPSVDALLAKLGEYRNMMCACADKACAEKIGHDFDEWGLKSSRSSRGSRPELTADQQRTAMDTMTAYVKCREQHAGAGAP